MAFVARSQSRAVFDRALSLGASGIQARILAGRLTDSAAETLEGLFTPHLKHLVSPNRLADIQTAVERLADAVMHGERIGILTDYDVDGVTSHLVLLTALRDHFGVDHSQLDSFIGHRIHDGYGISENLVERILNQPERPAVIITADCGSSDQPRIKLLAEAGIDVIVGDHHAIPSEGIPSSALAVVNPTRADCDYPDSSIAGVMVSWLIMSALRAKLIDLKHLPSEAPKLVDCLDAVALGTVADCVDLAGSAINRAVVNAGLGQMNQLRRAAWRSMARELGDDALPMDSQTLGFQVGPRINARGRIDDPMAALHWITAAYDSTADRYLQILSADNQARKDIERAMVSRCLPKALAQKNTQRFCVVVADDEGHPGVQGIVASRLTERTGLPSVVLAPAQNPEHYVGSMRSVPSVHARQALERCSEQLIRFGGHAGAAGLTLEKAALTHFAHDLHRAICEQVKQAPEPIREHDGELDPELIGPELMSEIQALEPYGRGFDRPRFEADFEVISARVVGQEPVHLSLVVRAGIQEFKTVWFRALSEPGADWPVQVGDRARLVWSPVLETFRGQTRYVPRIEGRVN